MNEKVKDTPTPLEIWQWRVCFENKQIYDNGFNDGYKAGFNAGAKMESEAVWEILEREMIKREGKK